jgi:magnesium transporter
MEELEDRMFDDVPRGLQVQRRIFQLRRSLVLLRRIAIPMSEVVGVLMRRDLRIVGDDLMPYYQDVYDQALRAAERTDNVRDLVSSIVETNLAIQGNRLNVITKKVTGWAAIIAVPTLITGFFGMNVPYPGLGEKPGLAASIATIALTGLVLYLIFSLEQRGRPVAENPGACALTGTGQATPRRARAGRSRRGFRRRSSSGRTHTAGCDARRTAIPGD